MGAGISQAKKQSVKVRSHHIPNIGYLQSPNKGMGENLDKYSNKGNVECMNSPLGSQNTLKKHKGEGESDVLEKIRVKNINRLIIGTLNINSLANKFEQLKVIVRNNLDVLVIIETKLDESFPTSQFLIEGFSQPFRLDRNRYGGG